MRGPATFGFAVTPAIKEEIVAVESAIKVEINKLIKNGVSDDEVARAIARLQASAIFARDSNRVPARLLGGALAINRSVEDVESWPDHIGNVNAKDISKAVHAVFADRPSLRTILLPEQE